MPFGFTPTLFVTILVLRGRVNFRNLSRYCDYSERTIARQFRKPFDWPDFHQRVLMTALDPHSELISAHDASFISKSGKQTFGLGHFFNGCAAIPAVHLRVLCDYGIRQRSQHFDHPFMALAETSAIR